MELEIHWNLVLHILCSLAASRDQLDSVVIRALGLANQQQVWLTLAYSVSLGAKNDVDSFWFIFNLI